MIAPVFSLLAAVSATPPTPANTPPDIKSIVPPQPFYIQAFDFWLVVAGVSIVLATVALWFLLRRPKKVVVPTFTPRQITARRLQELEARMDTLDARVFGGAVADVLRVYIGAQYGLHPERQTSEEFLASITGSRTFSVVEHALLREFLAGCDLLKFARADATHEGKRSLLAQAVDFLEGSKQSPPPLPTTQNALTPVA